MQTLALCLDVVLHAETIALRDTHDVHDDYERDARIPLYTSAFIRCTARGTRRSQTY